ncbi:hypothetical protein BT69DRAFT_1356612 [Atractiella rhizophila]|nr:hypothetical protein BT69DRAFT_1356612 [Atractiella rhizophila]
MPNDTGDNLFKRAGLSLVELMKEWILKFGGLMELNGDEPEIELLMSRVCDFLTEIGNRWEAFNIGDDVLQRVANEQLSPQRLRQFGPSEIAMTLGQPVETSHSLAAAKGGSLLNLPTEILEIIFQLVGPSRRILTLCKTLLPVIYRNQVRYLPDMHKTPQMDSIARSALRYLQKVPGSNVRHIRLLKGPDDFVEYLGVSKVLRLCQFVTTLELYEAKLMLLPSYLLEAMKALVHVRKVILTDYSGNDLLIICSTLPRLESLVLFPDEHFSWYSNSNGTLPYNTVGDDEFTGSITSSLPASLRFLRSPPIWSTHADSALSAMLRDTILRGSKLPPLCHLEFHTGLAQAEVIILGVLDQTAVSIECLKMADSDARHLYGQDLYERLGRCSRLRKLELYRFDLSVWDPLAGNGILFPGFVELTLSSCSGGGMGMALWVETIERMEAKWRRILRLDGHSFHNARWTTSQWNQTMSRLTDLCWEKYIELLQNEEDGFVA